jgi:hypothetical protein
MDAVEAVALEPSQRGQHPARGVAAHADEDRHAARHDLQGALDDGLRLVVVDGRALPVVPRGNTPVIPRVR